MSTENSSEVKFLVSDCDGIAEQDQETVLAANVEAIEQLVITTKSPCLRSQEHHSSE